MKIVLFIRRAVMHALKLLHCLFMLSCEKNQTIGVNLHFEILTFFNFIIIKNNNPFQSVYSFEK